MTAPTPELLEEAAKDAQHHLLCRKIECRPSCLKLRLREAAASLRAGEPPAIGEAVEALEAARVWWLGKTADGTLPHAENCNLTGDAVEAAMGCDCPSPLIHAALAAYRAQDRRTR